MRWTKRRKDKGASCNEGQQAEQPDCGKAVDADIDGPHEPRRQVLQQPCYPQMRKKRSDVLEVGAPFVSVLRFRGH
jgi:hypothetical protein